MFGFVSAVRTLTIIPLPGKNTASLSRALPWFPIVGLLAGLTLLGCSVLLGFALSGWVSIIAALVLLLQCVLTNALHLDGLADASDALFSMTGRERKLEIMKDSRLGTYGVLSLFMVLLIKWLLICKLVESSEMALLALVMLLSRTIQVELAVTMPYARSTDGTAKRFVDGANVKHRVAAWGIVIVLVTGFGPFAICAIPLAIVIGWMLKIWFSTKCGGVTGDLLGAANEYVEIALLFGISIWLHQLNWIHWPWRQLSMMALG